MTGVMYLRLKKLKMVECPICKWRGKEFLRFSKTGRKNAKCPRCRSAERHRLYYLYLKKNLNRSKSLTFLHIAPEKSITSFIKTFKNISYLSADLDPANAMVSEDITNTSFEDDSFDIIFCSHVLEHVDDDRKAMRELRRILKPSGFAMLQVPIKNIEETFEDFSVTTPEERERVFGQKDHVRIYGKDYVDRLIESGFKVKVDRFVDTLSDEAVKKYVLSKESIYICTK